MNTNNGRRRVLDALDGAVWRKSSYSGDSQGQCVEVADVLRTHAGIAVRDSKNPTGPILLFAPEAFATFVDDAVQGLVNQA
ncbi:DUF397 domain-containing protein [Streptomyces sp. NPDC050508]|uniref:DUF397 domain-containing protein n=1 Tax=Streptomyces sp. NPDC050508 TaxID=3155405 RepID=UPI0034448204